MKNIKKYYLFLVLFSSAAVIAEPFGCLNYDPATQSKINNVALYSVISEDSNNLAELAPYYIRGNENSKNAVYGWEFQPLPTEKFILKCVYDNNIVVSKSIPENLKKCIYRPSNLDAGKNDQRYKVICLKK